MNTCDLKRDGREGTAWLEREGAAVMSTRAGAKREGVGNECSSKREGMMKVKSSWQSQFFPKSGQNSKWWTYTAGDRLTSRDDNRHSR